jgi:hypothetical protein
MEKTLLDYESRLNAQQELLEKAEQNARIAVEGNSLDLLQYEVRGFFPYATPQDIDRILSDMKKRELDRDIGIIDNCLSFLEATLELVDLHRAHRNESGVLSSAPRMTMVDSDQGCFSNLKEKTRDFMNILFEENIFFDKGRLEMRYDALAKPFRDAAFENVPPKGAGLPLQPLEQRIHDLRAECGDLLIKNNELKLLHLSAEIDFVAVLRKGVDEGILPANAYERGRIEDHAYNISGHTVLAHENLATARSFFKELSETSRWDQSKGSFVATGMKDITILPLASYMP